MLKPSSKQKKPKPQKFIVTMTITTLPPAWTKKQIREAIMETLGYAEPEFKVRIRTVDLD